MSLRSLSVTIWAARHHGRRDWTGGPSPYSCHKLQIFSILRRGLWKFFFLKKMENIMNDSAKRTFDLLSWAHRWEVHNNSPINGARTQVLTKTIFFFKKKYYWDSRFGFVGFNQDFRWASVKLIIKALISIFKFLPPFFFPLKPFSSTKRWNFLQKHSRWEGGIWKQIPDRREWSSMDLAERNLSGDCCRAPNFETKTERIRWRQWRANGLVKIIRKRRAWFSNRKSS